MRRINRLQWGGRVGMNKFWRSIYVVEEKVNQQRRGFAISHTVLQPDQQARPSQCGAGDETQQAQSRESWKGRSQRWAITPHLSPWLSKVAAQDPE